jgi:hypothetical protein
LKCSTINNGINKEDFAMLRTKFSLVFSLVLCGFFCAACAKASDTDEITSPAVAAKDPDFKIQGEYVGEGTWLDGCQTKAGAQVIALGDGQFTVVVTKGGLPGDGWKRDEPRVSLSGKRDGEITALTCADGKGAGKIVGETMTLAGGNAKLQLNRTVRRSSTEGAKPPAGAVVLFDGTTADKFENGALTEDKNLWSEVTSKQGFGDCTLHLEFRLSYMPFAREQKRSNSGVYLHDCYEVQILDSFGLEGENNECGGFYQLRKPDVNMCLPPLTWQTYDIEFTAPKYQDGTKVANARVAVRQNGVLIQPEFELAHATPGREEEGPAPRALYLQGHTNKVQYRNIWLKEKK